MSDKKLIYKVRIENVILNWYYDGVDIYLDGKNLTPEEINETLEVAREFLPSPPVRDSYPVALESKINAGVLHIGFKIKRKDNIRYLDEEILFEDFPEIDAKTLRDMEDYQERKEKAFLQGIILD